MSTKTGRVLCIIAGILAVAAGLFLALTARDIWPLVIGIPCMLGGVSGIAAGIALGRNERASEGLLVAAAVASFVCLNLVSAIVFIAVRGYGFQAAVGSDLQRANG